MKSLKSYLALALCCVLLGCTDDSYKTRPVSYESFRTRETVWVSLGDTQTKGSGRIDEAKDFIGKDIDIYAFNRTEGTDYRITAVEDSLSCLVDGDRAYAVSAGGYLRWRDENHVACYPDLEKYQESFDFFASYLDGSRVGPVRRFEDSIECDVEIDGSMDLMTSMAAIPEKISKEVAPHCFSYFTAQMGIAPAFKMRHHLVRLDFVAIAGHTPGLSNNMTINKLSLQSDYFATMTIAAKDPSLLGPVFRTEDEAGKRTMLLTEPDGSTLQDFVVTTLADPEEKAVPATIGGSLFAAPSDSYSFTIEYSEDKGKPGEIFLTGSTDVRIPLEGGYLPGYSYRITMEFFGSDHISTYVELIGWNDGGTFSLTDDSDPAK